MYILNNILNNKNSFIWVMRQAGRYLPEYRNTRSNAGGFMDLCYNPELACEVTIQPINRFDFDAAIIFSDILVVLDALGIEVQFVEGKGPVLKSDLSALLKLDLNNLDDIISSKLKPVYEAISLVRKELPSEKSLIGFCGAFWTLFAYLIEEGGSKTFHKAKIFPYNEPEKFSKIKEILINAIAIHLRNQVNAGCDVVKIFDSWAGIFGSEQIREFVIKPTDEILKKISNLKVKKICFPKGIGNLAYEFCELDFDVYAMDYNFDISNAREIYNKFGKITQGNLDPAFLFTENQDVLKAEIEKIRNATKDIPHIFNLGHGVMPATPIKNMELLISHYRSLF